MDFPYLLIDSSVAPEVFTKVVRAKQLLASGKCKSTGEALAEVKISRSAFYKYKNCVYASGDLGSERIVTLFFTLDDIAGILSSILKTLAECDMSVLTINQNIPIGGSANMTISLRMNHTDVVGLLETLRKIPGVNKAEVLAMG